MTRREQLEQAAIEINMNFQTRLLDRLVAVGEWADAHPIPDMYSTPDKIKLAIAIETLEEIATNGFHESWCADEAKETLNKMKL